MKFLIKNCLFTSLLVLSLPSYGEWHYAIVNDPDGHANVRQSADLTSKVVATVANGTPIVCDDDYEPNPQFCDNENGAIHKSRLEIFDKNSVFKPVPLKTAIPTQVIYANKQANVLLKVTQKNLNPKDFTKGKYGYLYQGKPFYGTDNGLLYGKNGKIIYTSYFFDTIQVTIDGKTLAIPKSEFNDLFIPNFSIDEDNRLKSVDVFINPNDNHVYIFSSQSDGAGSYTAVFEFKNGRYHQRYLTGFPQ